MELALNLALKLIDSVWSASSSSTLIVDDERTFPYLCNNVYLMRADLYEHVISDQRLDLGGADEVMLNRVLVEKQLPICHLADSFVIHPAYSTAANKIYFESLTADAVERAAERILPLSPDYLKW